MTYEKLADEIEKEGVEIIEIKFKGTSKGLYSDNVIALDSKIETDNEKRCVLAEEIGHYYTSHGDILDISDIRNLKQEKRARNWGYEKLVGIIDLINAYKKGIKSRHDLAEYLNVTEEFLDKALKHYKEKHGLYYQIDKYVVYFEPLGILEIF